MSEFDTNPYYTENPQIAWRDVTIAVDTARVFTMPVRVNEAGTSIQGQIFQKFDQWSTRVNNLETTVYHPVLYIPELIDGNVIARMDDTVYTKDRDAFYNILLYGRSQVNKLPIDHEDVLQGAYDDFMYIDALASCALSYGADGVIYQMRFFEAIRSDGSRSDAGMPAILWYGSMGIEQYVRTMLADPEPSEVNLASIGLTKNIYEGLKNIGADVVDYVLQPWIQGNVLRKAYVD